MIYIYISHTEHVTPLSVHIDGEYEEPFPGEEINYNEQFLWADPWAQGQIGFGPFAGRLNQEFRAAQFRGVPLPIQWIAGYFTLDGEKIRWGRKFRQAGWYTHIFLWCVDISVSLSDLYQKIKSMQRGADI